MKKKLRARLLRSFYFEANFKVLDKIINQEDTFRFQKRDIATPLLV